MVYWGASFYSSSINVIKLLAQTIMISKTICNESDYPIKVILYFGRRGQDGMETIGTRQVKLVPGEARDIGFGDIRHSFINGIEFASVVQGVLLKTRILVEQSNSEFDQYLNSGESFSITGEWLNTITPEALV